MTKTVFTHKPNSLYDDLPEERYHFPATYLRQVERAVGDFIVYYEPGRTGLSERYRSGRRAYVATAMLTDITADPVRAGHYFALIDPSSYVEFDRPVPFREGDHYYERQLQRDMVRRAKVSLGERYVRLVIRNTTRFFAPALRRSSIRSSLRRSCRRPASPCGPDARRSGRV